MQTEKLGVVDPTSEDLVVVIGGDDAPRSPHPKISAWLRGRAAACRLCGIGAGADMLVQSLGLDTGPGEGQRDERGPKSREQRQPVGSQVGPVWTCRGKTAALDLMLMFVAQDLGRPQALRVVEALFMYVWRRPNEPLLSVIFELQKRGETRFPTLHDYIRMHLAEDLQVERLADLCGMTPRTFARLYLKETGVTPAVAVTSIRLQVAKTLVEGHALTLARISELTGFGSELSLRRAFLRAFGKPPAEGRN